MPRLRRSRALPVLLSAFAALLLAAPSRAGSQPEPARPQTPAAPVVAVAPKAPATDAEKIANTRDSIKQATAVLEKLQKRLVDPEGEYAKSEAEFELLNGKLKTLKATAAKLRKSGDDAEAVAVETTLPAIQEDWQLAKDRFDIAIRQKKATQETIDGLTERIASEQRILDQLVGTPPATPAPPVPAPTPTNPQPARPTPAATKSPDPARAPASNAEARPVPEPPPSVTLPGMPGLPAASGAAAVVPVSLPDETDPIVLQARVRLETRRGELREVEARARVAEERVRVMERSIQNATKTRGLEQEAVTLAEKTAKLSNTICNQPPADRAELDALMEKLVELETRLGDSRSRVRRIEERIGTFNESLAGLRAERDIVAREADEAQQRVAAADAELDALLNPTAARRLYRWVVAKGPRVLFIVVGMLLAHLASRQFSHHIVRFITRNSHRGSPADRENRASTLVGVFRYAVGLVVFGGGVVMILDEVGVPIVPIMGGAAVIGLAVAFGAQNLIRDYFTGFMMLMEDQYSVNDVVRVGSTAGLVELITLRVTVLRDLEGVRHFIPHGTVTSVSNLTHGWSRAKIDVPVAYKENVDRVIGVLLQLGREIRLDPVLGTHVVEDAEMLGVDDLSDSGVVVRFLLKTRPLQQWPVKREMLRRIKNRFDELGIEIPFPHRTVFHRFPDGTADAPAFVREPGRYAA